jgi:hypothetical protein
MRGLKLEQGRAHLVPVGGDHGRHQHPAQASVLLRSVDLQSCVYVLGFITKSKTRARLT